MVRESALRRRLLPALVLLSAGRALPAAATMVSPPTVVFTVTRTETEPTDDYLINLATDGAGNIHTAAYDNQLGWRWITYDDAGNVTSNAQDYDPAYGSYTSFTVDAAGNRYAFVQNYVSPSYRFRLAKFGPTGTLLWSRTVSSAFAGWQDNPVGGVVAANGNIVLAGYRYDSNAGVYYTLVSAVDASGALQWSFTLGGIASIGAYGNAIAAGLSGTVYVGGRAPTGTQLAQLYALDPNGAVTFSRTIGAPNQQVSGLAFDATASELVVQFSNMSSGNRQLLRAYDATSLVETAATSFNDTVLGFWNQIGRIFAIAGGGVGLNGAYYTYADGQTHPIALRYSSALQLQPGWPSLATEVAGSYLYATGRSGGGLVYSAGTSSAACVPSNTDIILRGLAAGGGADWTVLRNANRSAVSYNVRAAADGGGTLFVQMGVGQTQFVVAHAPGGAVLWSRTILSPADYCNLVPQGLSADGGVVHAFYRATTTPSAGYWAVVDVPFNAGTGAPLAAQYFSQANHHLYIDGMQHVSGSGYVGGGYVYNANDGFYHGFVFKLDESFNQVWYTETAQTGLSSDGRAAAADGAGDGYVLISDPTVSPNVSRVVKVSGGVEQWSVTLSGTATQTGVNGYDLVGAPAGVYVLGYESGPDQHVFVTRLDAAGAVSWSRSVPDPAAGGLWYPTPDRMWLDQQGNIAYGGYGYDPATGWGPQTGLFSPSGEWLTGRTFAAEYQNAHLVAGAATGGVGTWAIAQYSQDMRIFRLAGRPITLTATPTPSPAAVRAPLTYRVRADNNSAVAITGATASVTALQGSDRLGLIFGPVPASTAIPANGFAEFTWTFSVTGAGPLEFSATVVGTLTDGGGSTSQAADSLLAADDEAELSVTVSGAAVSYVSQAVEYVAVVENVGTGTAYNVTPRLANSLPATLTAIGSASPASVTELGPDGRATFTWGFTVTGDGNPSLTASVLFDSGIFGTLTRTGSFVPVLLRPAAFTGVARVVPAQVSAGQTIKLEMTVTNTGQVNATGVSDTVSIDAGAGLISPAPLTQGGLTFPGNNYANTFTWNFVTSGSGPVAFTVSVAGTDSGLGGALLVAASAAALVQTPAALQASVSVSATQIKTAGGLVVTLSLTNTGQASATGLTPSVVPAASTAGVLASLLPGTPAGPFTLAGGATTSVVWVLSGIAAGAADLTVTITGTDGNSGASLNFLRTTPVVTIVGAPHLAAAAHSAVASAKVGDTFGFSLTVTNTGNGPATAAWFAFASADPDALEVVTAPATVPLLAAGQATTANWTLKARKTGPQSLTGRAAATDPGDGSSVDTAAQAAVTVFAALEKPSAAFPNPVSGDTFRLGLELTQDATEVVVDVYNPALKLAFERKWTTVALTDGPLVIDGVMTWAPGFYLVKATATYADGSKKTFPTVKVLVKR